MGSFFGNTSVGAFLGSFTAFIFGIIAYDYTKKREKWVVHHNALVETERLINRHLNQISNNIFLLKGSIDTFSKSAFSENELSALEDPDHMIDFHNIELINTYQDYEALLEKVNHDMVGWNKSNDRLFNVALSGRVPPQDIEINRQGLSKRSKELINHLSSNTEFLKRLPYLPLLEILSIMDLLETNWLSSLRCLFRAKLTAKKFREVQFTKFHNL